MIMSKSLGAAGVCAILFFPMLGSARQGTPPLSRQLKVQTLQAVKQLTVAATDARAEKAADEKIGVTTPLRFAVPTPAQITPATDGTWENVPGGRIWRLRIASAGATDLNFGFTTCWLPEGATLHISSEIEDYFQGPYTARDNKPHEQLWTPVVPGGAATIELFVPADAKEEPRLVLSQINRGYRDMFHRQKDLNDAKAGSCNNDVICSLGDPWRKEIRSVARYSIGGSGLCTGTLMNNAAGNSKNLFLTANHCGLSAGNAASVVVYWNYESPTCGQHGGGSLSQNQNGTIFRAAKADVDMALIELEDVPDSTFRVYYAGWDRSGIAPVGAVGIHHPAGDEKSISFSTTTLTTVDDCIGTGGVTSHWRVVWSSGTTEPGSSGSGIWNPVSHQVVGFLSGGGASCGSPGSPDCYGKFSVAWTNAGSAATRLCDWLDPQNTGVASVQGFDPLFSSTIIAAGSAITAEGCTPTNGAVDPEETVTVNLSLRNIGGLNAANVIATLQPGNGVTVPSAPQNYGLLSTNGTIVTRSFSFVATGACGNVISPTLQLQSGSTNLGTVSFTFRLGVPTVTFTQRFDTVTAPTLPTGWTNLGSNAVGWFTTTAAAHTPPNSAFAATTDLISDAFLTSPSIPITTTAAQVSFRHRYNTEEGFDGGVLEISINNSPFDDIASAGGIFASGGYDLLISDAYGSPITNRYAWSGDSVGFISTVVNLPSAAAGQNIRLRWRLASDESLSTLGWYVDTIAVSDGYRCCTPPVPPLLVDAKSLNNKVIFSFNSLPGQTYITEYQGILSTGVVWTALQTNLGDGTRKSVTNAPGSSRFIRVKTHNNP